MTSSLAKHPFSSTSLRRSRGLGAEAACAAASLLVPSMVYSGSFFFSSLHMAKWLTAVVPLIVCVVWALVRRGKRGVAVDGFSVGTGLGLGLLACQSLLIQLSSPEEWLGEWLVASASWAALVVWRRFPIRHLPALLAEAGLLGGLSTLGAELQFRGLAGNFGGWAPLIELSDVYIANVGQQNMLALWLALGALGGLAVWVLPWSARSRPSWRLKAVALVGGLASGWGLWGTTSRSGLLSLAVALAALAWAVGWGRARRQTWRRLAVGVALLATLGAAQTSFDRSRSGVLAAKTEDAFSEPMTFGSRSGIWKTSMVMWADRPFLGVGLGQFKWNYLAAQTDALRRWPGMKRQFTWWAHNEPLQWACETGTVGLCLAALLVAWWLARLVTRRHGGLTPAVCWAVATVALIGFDSLWTRPFHRVEYLLWLIFALALMNRRLFAPLARRKLGIAISLALGVLALVGGPYLIGAAVGDRLVARALATRDVGEAMSTLRLAERFPMMGYEARRELARAMLFRGRSRSDPNETAQGINLLVDCFLERPSPDDLALLRFIARADGLAGLTRDLAVWGPLLPLSGFSSSD